MSIVAQVVYFDFHQALVLRALKYGATQGRLQHLGQYGNDIDAHDLFFVKRGNCHAKLVTLADITTILDVAEYYFMHPYAWHNQNKVGI